MPTVLDEEIDYTLESIMEDKINYKIRTSKNDDILKIVVSGSITKEVIDYLHNDVIRILKEKHPRAVLCDISSLKGRFDDFAEAFFRTRDLPQDVTMLPGAVVDTSDNITFISFYETTAANVGQTMKWFSDINEARVWLKKNLEEMDKK